MLKECPQWEYNKSGFKKVSNNVLLEKNQKVDKLKKFLGNMKLIEDICNTSRRLELEKIG